MVGHRPLEASIGVRVPDRQPECDSRQFEKNSHARRGAPRKVVKGFLGFAGGGEWGSSRRFSGERIFWRRGRSIARLRLGQKPHLATLASVRAKLWRLFLNYIFSPQNFSYQRKVLSAL